MWLKALARLNEGTIPSRVACRHQLSQYVFGMSSEILFPIPQVRIREPMKVEEEIDPRILV